jgi:predicted secreted protein
MPVPKPATTVPPLLLLLLLLLLAALPGAAPLRAQPAETVLRLSETAEVTRAPDELRTTLRAEARAGTAAAAQAAVNAAVAAALERARGVASVRAATGGYGTWRQQDPPVWVATQTVALRGREAAPLLELAGALQQGGLALAGLEWSLSREAEREAREEAGRIALDALRRRAAALAAQLDMTVTGLREVRVDAPHAPPPRPMEMAMRSAGAARAAAPPPVTAPEDAVVRATVEAELLLRPGR